MLLGAGLGGGGPSVHISWPWHRSTLGAGWGGGGGPSVHISWPWHHSTKGGGGGGLKNWN